MALRLVIWSALTMMACVWTTQVRMQRADLMQDEEQAKRQARLDPLTGLGNRRAFDERLDRAIDHARLKGEPLSVIVSDLDDFKEINDSYGHLNGDELLRTAAAAMLAAVRDNDACYRWGGDEFAVLLPGVEQDVAEKVAERVSREHRRLVHPPGRRSADARVGHRRARAAHAGVRPAGVGRPRADDPQAQAPARHPLPVGDAGLRVELTPRTLAGVERARLRLAVFAATRAGPVRRGDAQRIAAERGRGARLGRRTSAGPDRLVFIPAGGVRACASSSRARCSRARPGLLFGTAAGTPIALAFIVLGAVMQMSISRYLAGDAAAHLLPERVKRFDRFIEERGFWAVFYMRLAPAIPYNLVNYGAGLTSLKARAMAAGTAVGALPRTFAWVALGGSLDDLGSPEAKVAIALLVVMAVGRARSSRGGSSASERSA